MMNMTFKFGLAAAVVAVGAMIGINYLAGPDVGGPGPAELNSEQTPTPKPSVAEPSIGAERGLPQGQQGLTDGEGPSLPITVTIPAPGWDGEPHAGVLTKNDNPDAPDGAGMIVFFGSLYVYEDPCQWSGGPPQPRAATVDGLVAALAAQASRDASAPEDITLDGYAGKSITLHVPSDAVLSDCDEGTFTSWKSDEISVGPSRFNPETGQIDEVWIVNVNGQLVTIAGSYYEGTPRSIVDELRAIVESITFEVP